MKFRITFFSVFSILIFLSGLIVTFSGGNLGPLFGFGLIALAVVLFIVYLVFKATFKTSYWKHITAEFVLFVLAYIIFIFSSDTLKFDIHKPLNYSGYFYIVYGVEGKTKFDIPGITRKINQVDVPTTGVVLAANPYPSARYFGTSYIIYDTTVNGVEKKSPGYGLPFAFDSLICNGKKYYMDIFYFGWHSAEWNFDKDTVNRNIKKNIACDLLKE